MGSVTKIEFDGLEIRLLGNDGKTVARAPAVSGRPLLQNPGFSKLIKKGPLPEGRYHILKQNIEHRFSLDDPNNIAWAPGYGYNRVTLLPDDQTELHGRSGFFLHGSMLGNGYGSAGCIDLNTEDGRIFDVLRGEGADEIEVTVKYAEMLHSEIHPVFQQGGDLEALEQDALANLKDAVQKQPDAAGDKSFLSGVKNMFGPQGLETVLKAAPLQDNKSGDNGFDAFGAAPADMLAEPEPQPLNLLPERDFAARSAAPLSQWQTISGADPVLSPEFSPGSETQTENLSVLPGSELVAEPPAWIPDNRSPAMSPALEFQPPETSYDSFLRLGATPETEALAIAEYNALFKKSFLDMNGDLEAAELLAADRFLRTWRPSDYAAEQKGTLLAYPVEVSYPPDEKVGQGYVEEEARRFLESRGLSPSRVFLDPNDKTGSDLKRGATDSSGHGPRLTLTYEDADGRQHLVTDAFQARVPFAGNRAVSPAVER